MKIINVALTEINEVEVLKMIKTKTEIYIYIYILLLKTKLVCTENKFGVETVLTQTLLVNSTNSYKEMANNTLDLTLQFSVEKLK